MFKWTIVLVLPFVLTACSSGPQADYAKLGLVEVSGTVTLDGAPVEGAAVYLYAADETYSFGVTDSSGNYTMMLNSDKSGVMPGEKRVEISTMSNPLGEAADAGEMEEDPDAAPAGKSEKIPACYNAETKLKVNITSADSSFDFELKSDCSTTSAT